MNSPMQGLSENNVKHGGQPFTISTPEGEESLHSSPWSEKRRQVHVHTTKGKAWIANGWIHASIHHERKLEKRS